MSSPSVFVASGGGGELTRTARATMRRGPWAAGAALVAAAAAVAAGCGAAPEASPEPTVPPLSPRPGAAFCLAGVDIPADPEAPIAFPDRLSDTGCFEDVAADAPAPDLVPYRINAPLWTDGVDKRRYLALPPGEAIGVTHTGAWDFPERSVLVKQFLLEPEAGVPDSRRVLETRLMLRARGAWVFASYRRIEADGGDATFSLDPVTVTYPIADGDQTRSIAYDYPSEMGCEACHADVAGEALGPRTAQLNRVLPFETGPENQLAAMRAIGLFAEPDAIGDPAALPRFADPADDAAPLEDRARAYLHANCGHCHLPGGYNSTLIDIDLRLDVAFADARVCGEPIRHPIHIGEGALVIDPGNPDNSNLYGRMLASGISKMPPLGRSIPDPLGTALVQEWIAGMSGCP